MSGADQNEKQLSQGEYLDLWKHFQEEASQIKSRMWTITAWLYALLTGLLGFLVKSFIPLPKEQSSETGKIFFVQPNLVIIMIIVGIPLCLFTISMIYFYGTHIVASWKRANYILEKYKGLKSVWDLEDAKDLKTPVIPNEAKWLIGLTIGFAVVYSIILAIAAGKML